jgi:hypothetical protein
METTKYFSSTIDFCEINNEKSSIIVEFWNSISSLFISFLGLVSIYYYPNRIILHHTLIIIGITSFYFHATLSTFAQILYELSIGYSIVVSLQYINCYIHKISNRYYLMVINIIQIIILFICPTFNRLILFMYVGYYYKIINKIKDTECTGKTIKYINVAQNIGLIAIGCMLIDYLCIVPINLHAISHILLGITTSLIFDTLCIIRTSVLFKIK